MANEPILRGLNPEQRRAVRHGGGDKAAAPLRIIAGAGSGKTKCLAHRVAHLLLKGADPRRILLLTFTNKAAVELASRTNTLLGRSHSRPLLWSGTFHRVAARLVRRFCDHLDLKPNFTILDADDATTLMTWARRQVEILPDEEFPKPSALLNLHSYAVNARKNVKRVMRERGMDTVDADKVRCVLKVYAQAKRTQNVVDFDDLLVFWLRLMQGPARNAIRKLFDFVLVDEFQDTNVLQMSILSRLTPSGAGLTVVGDDAQAIYSFRAANVDNILRFGDSFTAPTTTVTLDRNYRSTRRILRCANAVMAGGERGIKKKLRATRVDGVRPKLLCVEDSFAEARVAADRIQKCCAMGAPLREQAVLFRASFHSISLEVELGRRGIRFRKLGGQRFVDAAHVKDVLAVLRWVENTADRASGFRALRLVRGIGAKTAEKLLHEVSRVGVVPALLAYRPPPGLALAWQNFVAMMMQVSASDTPLTAAVAAIVAWLRPSLNARFDNPEERHQELGQLTVLAAQANSRAKFLEGLTLDDRNDADNDDDVLTLSTIHSAKGLEFHHVQILRVNELSLPFVRAETDDEIEEERRLLYVAMTRAKDFLAMFVLRTEHRPSGQAASAEPSSFLTRAMRRRCDMFEVHARRFEPLDADWNPINTE